MLVLMRHAAGPVQPETTICGRLNRIMKVKDDSWWTSYGICQAISKAEAFYLDDCDKTSAGWLWLCQVLREERVKDCDVNYIVMCCERGAYPRFREDVPIVVAT